MLGIVCLGLFGQKIINDTGFNGLLYGDSTNFFMKQLAAIVISSIYAFVFTYVMLVVIDKFSRVRVAEGDEEAGLDTVLHGETAYV